MSKYSNKKISVQDTAKVIRAVRKQLKLTQIFVSKKLSVSQGSLSKMETGKAEPSALQWMEFCRMTGIPMDILLRDDFKIASLKPVKAKGR
jgi:transcriptional regulator with XRE-family HTH domain